MLKRVFNVILNALFPNVCASCKAVINEDFLCEFCFENLERTSNNLCLKCGAHKKNCDCKNRVFNFEGITAPFYNISTARRAMYRYKFNGKKYIADFFAEQMALSVKQSFPEIEFDIITFVPMHISKRRKREYNQSEVLAEKISHILNIPISRSLLSSKKKKFGQFSLPLNLRFDNVKGIYYTNFKVTGKTVLLVDDIKTTGATLNECAMQLLIAGASRVYCVTGLTTSKKKGQADDN